MRKKRGRFLTRKTTVHALDASCAPIILCLSRGLTRGKCFAIYHMVLSAEWFIYRFYFLVYVIATRASKNSSNEVSIESSNVYACVWQSIYALCGKKSMLFKRTSYNVAHLKCKQNPVVSAMVNERWWRDYDGSLISSTSVRVFATTRSNLKCARANCRGHACFRLAAFRTYATGRPHYLNGLSNCCSWFTLALLTVSSRGMWKLEGWSILYSYVNTYY